jgi:nucleoside-triphosphatase THEP1
MDQTILLTGRRGVGKTTICQAVAELARLRGYRPGGVITPALYACPEPFDFTQDRHSRRACPAGWELGVENWELTKVGFEAVDVSSGERWPLAYTDPSTGSGRGPSTILRQGSGHCQEMGGPRVGPYSFDPAALARALSALERAISAGCDLFMVDEIGPLELEQGKGFAPILDLLPVEGPTHTLIVVRPALLDPLLLRLRGAVRRPCRTGFTVFSVTEENRGELPLQIVEALWGDG